MGYSFVEVLITIAVSCALIVISFGFFRSFYGLFGEFEKDLLLTKMYTFKEYNLLKKQEGRFILYDRSIEYGTIYETEKLKLDWLKIDKNVCEEFLESGAGVLKLNGNGFPSGSGSFILKNGNNDWKITFTPVVGKINVYRSN
ncbi:MAG: hypothetical protein PWQ20_1477 [Thermotogaceae bacterium]|nr:hypothetical protein [Thermotogaceae bacterium]MDN5338407.1 hypothetical protein [Thermotogaceae bacterium]